MRKILTGFVVAFLVLSVLPMIIAEEGTINGDVSVGVEKPEPECHAPEVFIDHTARGWYPNDQTYYTAEEYGNEIPSKYAGSMSSLEQDTYVKYVVPDRQNYVFTGETVDYYVIVRDLDGDDDIASVQLMVGENPIGSCAEVNYSPDEAAFEVNFVANKANTYVCRLIVPSTLTDPDSVSIRVMDGADSPGCEVSTVETDEIDWLNFNPSLDLTLDGTVISFGKAIPGETTTSNAIKLKNAAEANSGVLMDMYIASDDYFTDTEDSSSICGAGNGIKYDKFSYYAIKGSINSGTNNAVAEGLGAGDGNPDRNGDICESNPDEFTTLPSHSGEIGDMCRIINTQKDASLLTQGSSMSITFKLDLTGEDVNTAEECHGNFNNGQFHFVGRVI